ncbi:MAG: acyltransferase [Lachnospiraceae bacterium]|nr:acyltransferase [Lachnospiraceae bacterium]
MREKWIDAVKAIAVLFVLLGHAGVKIPYVSDFAVLFYVPVFFVLAGYLHHHREEEGFFAYVRKRAKRLLVPYFGYSFFLLLFYAAKEGMAGTLTLEKTGCALGGILYARSRLYPVEYLHEGQPALMGIWNSPMWFLPALFLTELLFELLIRWTKGKRIAVLWACVGCAGVGGVLHYMLPFLLPWSLENVLMMELLMACGMQLKAYAIPEWLGKHPAVAVLVFGAAAGIRLCNGAMNVSLGNWGSSLALGFAAAMLASAGIMAVCRRLDGRLHESDGLILIGQNTIPVLCLHMFVFMFAEAGIRIFLPGFPEEKGALYEAARIGMVLLTIDGLVIGRLWAGRIENCVERIGKS